MDPHQMGNSTSDVSDTATSGHNAGTDSSGRVWRPWHDAPGTRAQSISTATLLQTCNTDQSHTNDKLKLPAFQHPVKLFWPRSRCYDFLYQEAEDLLRNFPVQATISLYQETDSDSSSEGEEISDN
ncbi:protein ripply2.1-like [Rhinophrynus dorsalis]